MIGSKNGLGDLRYGPYVTVVPDDSIDPIRAAQRPRELALTLRGPTMSHFTIDPSVTTCNLPTGREDKGSIGRKS